MSNFEALGLLPELISAVEAMGWSLPSDVQDESIPLILGGADTMIAAETGSGKTGAFALPLLQLIYEALNGTAQIDGAPVAAASSHITLNPFDRDSICSLSPSLLQAQARHQRDWAGCRCTVGASQQTRGKYMFEAMVTDEGLCRVGFSTPSCSNILGTESLSFGYGGTGKKSCSNKFDDYGEPFAKDDVIGCLVDFDNRDISFCKNGRSFGSAFRFPPLTEALFPGVTLKNAEMSFEFETARFPQQGYLMWTHLAPRDRGTNQAEQPQQSNNNNNNNKRGDGIPLLAMIIEPTRELAQQVYDELVKFKINLLQPSINVACFVGGVDMKVILNSLRAGVHIVVGTPGRLSELVKSGKLGVEQLKFFVLDEADQLMDVGNKPDVFAIYERVPNAVRQNMQVVICSATLHSQEINDLAATMTVEAQWVDLKGKDSVPDTVDHVIIMADPVQDQTWLTSGGSGCKTDGIHKGVNLRSNSDDALSEGIKLLKPQILIQVIDEFKMESCLIFVRTQLDCDNLEDYLIKLGGGQRFLEKTESGKENPYSCVVLHGGRSPPERTRNLQAFKEGDVRFLICTDVAARGIDIKNLPYVINLCLPDKPEVYIHRIGRVGRADDVGLAISIVATHKEKMWWHNCNRSDKGRGCTNTNLTSKGGCTIWFDEMNMLKQIESRLGSMQIPHLERNNLLKGAAFIIEQASKGRKKVDDGSIESEQHVQVLKPTVEELCRLEVNAQYAYLAVKHSNKWANMLK